MLKDLQDISLLNVQLYTTKLYITHDIYYNIDFRELYL